MTKRPRPCTDSIFRRPEEPPVYIESEELFCYLNMPQEQHDSLCRALAEAEELVVEVMKCRGAEEKHSTFTLSRGGALAETLDTLSRVPRWLERHLYRFACVDPAYFVTLRLLGAEGVVLWLGNPWSAYYQPKVDARPVSLFSQLRPYLPEIR